MEAPSSPMISHFLSRQVHPTTQSNAEVAASPLALASPTYPDGCLLPNPNAKASLSRLWVPKPKHRHTFLPSSLQHPNIGSFSSLKGNEDGNNNETEMMKQCVMTNNNPSLQVDCHFFSPPPNVGSQPITPSPKCANNLHDNCSGWKVPCVSLEKASCSNELDSEGRRTGYDGTNQTPSIQLLKPTASSLGHRVHKAVAVRSQQARSPINSMHDNPYCLDSPDISHPPQEESTQMDMHCFDSHKERGDQNMKIMTFKPSSSPLDPFGKLNNSNHNTASDGDEMDEETQNSSSLLDDFDFNHCSSPRKSKRVLQRCASWSPGYGNNRGFDMSEKSCSERLRSYNIDPVASQLLRECTVYEEDQGEAEQEMDPLSMSSHVIGRMSGLEGAGSCHSPIPLSNNANFVFCSSMPDLLSPMPLPVMANEQGDRNKGIPEEASIDYPLSPVPLFRNVSGSLRDVHTDDDIKYLARPVPRKFSMPDIGSSPRKSSFPARHW